MPPLCAAITRYLAFLWPGRHIVSLSFVRKPDHDDREHHLSRRAAIDESRFAVFSQDGRIHWQQHACIRSQPQNRSIHAARRFGPTGSGDSLRTSSGVPRLRLAIARLMGGWRGSSRTPAATACRKLPLSATPPPPVHAAHSACAWSRVLPPRSDAPPWSRQSPLWWLSF
jgi:hypothetical protein